MGIACIVALAVLVPLQILLVSGSGSGEPPLPARAGSVVAAPVTPPVTTPPPLPPVAAPEATPLPDTTGVPDTPTVVVEGEMAAAPAVAPPPAATPARALAFDDRRSAHAQAVQDPANPATTRWALLVGINEHRGGVSDNIGSRQDAEAMREHLLANGWLDDHIMLLTDRAATGAAIRDGLRWLAEKTDESSVAIFHFSGHSKKWYRNGSIRQIGLWSTNHDFVVESELVSLLEPVRPAALWLSFATCNAGAFAAPGLAQPGRVITFSSERSQKSYEHPSWGHSVWGWFLIQQGMRSGLADLDGDGRVSVEEAWSWARPHAIHTTKGQRYGSQDAVIIDDLDGEFHVGIPGVEPAPPAEQPAADTQPQPGPQPQQPAPRPEPEPEEREPERHGGYLCLLCGGR
jgi:hypothetical protein